MVSVGPLCVATLFPPLGRKRPQPNGLAVSGNQIMLVKAPPDSVRIG